MNFFIRYIPKFRLKCNGQVFDSFSYVTYIWSRIYDLIQSMLNFRGVSMKTYALMSVILIIVASLCFTGFQCGSAESTSAKLYMKNRDFEKAEAALMKDLEKDPNNAESWYFLGDVRREMKNYQGMIEAFDKCLKSPNGKEFEAKISDEK